MRRRYLSGEIPWDESDPPPEVIQLAATMTPGQALDVGCGYGRAAIHLALRGWFVDAVDFVPEALEVARQRAEVAGVAHRIRFLRATVPELSLLSGGYDLILDVGCGHALADEHVAEYLSQLARLAKPGGTIAWFVRVRESGEVGEPESGPRGIDLDQVLERLRPDFILDGIEHGRSGAGGSPAWPSAWIWLRRA